MVRLEKCGRYGWRCSLFRVLLWVAIVVLAGALVDPSPVETQIEAQTASKKKKAPANPATSVPAPAPAPAAPTPPPPPLPDPLGRGTPFGCVRGFLLAAERGDYTQAAKYLDTKKTGKQSEQLALQLKALIDLGISTDLNSLSRVPEGDLKDNLPPTQERVGVVTTPEGQLEVVLDRAEVPNQQPIWLFSQETLKGVPDAYDSIQHRDFGHYFPAWMSRIKFLSFPLWRWAVSLLALCVTFLLAGLSARIVLWLLQRAFRGRITQAAEALVLRLRSPIFWLMTAIVEKILSRYSTTALGRSRWEVVSTLTATVSITWLMIRLTAVFESYLRHRYTMRLQIERITFVVLLARMFKILVAIALVITLLTRAGVNVSALITGLGVGGVALAFAAQRTLSDLFGGISIVMRGAVRVGDFCTIAGKQGTVEEVGISSLRMRTLDRTVVTIPNSKVAEMDLENFTMRDQFWLHQVFTLRFDTPYSVVQTVLRRMVDVLNEHPDIDIKTARVRLIQLTDAGPQVEVFAYYRRPGTDYAAFLAEQEPVILEMMRVVEEEGTAMVAPVGVVQMQETGKTVVSRQ